MLAARSTREVSDTLPAKRRSRWSPGALLTATFRWKTFSIGIFLILLFIFCAIFAKWIAPYDPAKPDFKALLQHPSREHLFGTDDKGRDIFSRVIYGSRISIRIALISVGLAMLIGMPLGLIAGYVGGWFDTMISRFLDAMFAFPVI